MGFPHGRVGRNLPDGEAYAYCGVIVEGSGLGEHVRKVLNPVISPLSEHRRGLIMLCNSDFSERLGGWESVIWGLSVEGHALDTEPSTISRFSVEGPRSGYRTIHDFTVQRGRSCSVYRTIHDITVQRGKSPPGSRHKAGGASQRRNSRSLL